MMDQPPIPSTYASWLDYTFKHRADNFENLDYENVVYDWDVNPRLCLDYIARLFADPVASTRAYSDMQINRAFWRIISSGEPDLHHLFNSALPTTLRLQIAQDMVIVFEQLFAPRCTSILSAGKQNVDHLNPLNSVCYMWWEIVPFVGKSPYGEQSFFEPYCLEVMQKTLALDSVACQESALHGLGHWADAYPEFVQTTIDAFLQCHPNIEPELRAYALAARWGGVM